MLRYSSEDELFDRLALTKVTDATQLKVGDRIKVRYSGWNIQIQDSAVVAKKKIECLVNATIVNNGYGKCIQLSDTSIRKTSSKELKNFKKGWDGKSPGVGASWGGTSVGNAFLSSGCKIVGRYS